MYWQQNRQAMSVRTYFYRIFVSCLLFVWMLGACAISDRTSSQLQLPISTAVISQNAAPCATVTPVALPPSNGAPRGSQTARYDSDAKLIIIPNRAELTIPELEQVIHTPQALKKMGGSEWFLGASIRIEHGGKLQIGGPEVTRLRLRSAADGFVSIKALGGTLEIFGTCVTSWDAAHHDVDANYADGRSFILARDGGRMVIRDSELSYLGYSEDESYGVAWRLPGTSGEITNSKLGYNFYGLYLFRASDIVITGNEVYHSVRYGIDPHTSSNRLRIENNRSHDNGKHGIILANGSNDSVIRNNEVFSNTLHGIVLYKNSNNNIVEGNTVYDNGQEGIDVNDSADNVIHNNIVRANTDAGIGIGQGARKNTVEGNQVYMNHNDGISLYSDAIENILMSNVVHGNNRYGLYIKSSNNTIGHNNEIYENQVGVYINVSPAPDISRTLNHIYQNHDADVRSGN